MGIMMDTDIVIFKSIADNFQERKKSAALSNYFILCNNIQYLSDTLKYCIDCTINTHKIIELCISDISNLNNDFTDKTSRLFYYKYIIPRIILNDIAICKKFYDITMPDDRSFVGLANVAMLSKSFVDYNNLVTCARQFIDSMVVDSYQLLILEPKEFNYQVLTSLNSFSKYATKSLRATLFNADVETSLKEFSKLNFNQWSNSEITQCQHNSFAKKIDFLFDTLSIVNEDKLKDEFKNLFKFSSEFTHIGFVSTFYTDSQGAEVIFGDECGPYLPSTENFSELKYEILLTSLKFFSRIYIKTLCSALKTLFISDTYKKIEENLDKLCVHVENDISSRNNKYYFFITNSALESKDDLSLTCMCGFTTTWEPPHDIAKAICKSCGSTFQFMVLDGDPGYIFTSAGPVKVIGSSKPEIEDLPEKEKADLFERWQKEISKNT